MLDNDMRLKRLLIMTYMYACIHIYIYKECLTTVQARPSTFAHWRALSRPARFAGQLHVCIS